MAERTPPTPLWINQNELHRINRACKLLGCSRSELIRDAIRLAAMEKVRRG